MIKFKIRLGLYFLFAAFNAFSFSTCLAAKPQKTISINFAAVVGNEPFACGQSYAGIGLSKSHITPSDLRFYVSDVELLDRKGRAIPLELQQDGVWQYQNITLLDFENGSGPCLNGNAGIHKTITGSVPNQHYQGLRLTLGLPDELNHGDPTLAPPPLNVTSMFWSWRGGYKFVRLDMATTAFPQIPKLKSKSNTEKSVEPESDGSASLAAETSKTSTEEGKPGKTSGFAVHLGSTACVSPSRTIPPIECHNPNRVTIVFDEFDVDKNVIVVDVADLLADTDVDYHTTNSAPGCMSDPKDADCYAIMSAFGVPFNDQTAFPQHFLHIK